MPKQSLYNFLGSYNKAYKTKKVEKKDFDKFLVKLNNFYQEMKNVERASEELLKSKFKECLLDEYQTFSDANRVDLAIHKNGKTQVICEFKQPTNKNAIIHEAKSYNVSSFKEYKIVKSFNYIKQIDDIVCKLYNLTDEETEYIKNYEIEYRISDDNE